MHIVGELFVVVGWWGCILNEWSNLKSGFMNLRIQFSVEGNVILPHCCIGGLKPLNQSKMESLSKKYSAIPHDKLTYSPVSDSGAAVVTPDEICPL